jgi:hypothetical protein
MPLPRRHIERMHKELRDHEERLSYLRDQISRLSEEAAAHETIIRLGRDERLIGMLGDIYDDESLVIELTDNADKFLHQKGIQLPARAQLEVSTRDKHTILSLRFAEDRWSYSCVWDPANGFSLVQHTLPPDRQNEASE